MAADESYLWYIEVPLKKPADRLVAQRGPSQKTC